MINKYLVVCLSDNGQLAQNPVGVFCHSLQGFRYYLLQIWSLLSGTQVCVSREGDIGVTKLSFLPGR